MIHLRHTLAALAASAGRLGVVAGFAAVVVSARAAQKPAAPFTSPYTLDDMKGKQAVVETSMGTFVIALMPEAAPTHVAYFMKTARDGGYNGTTFHRVIKYGLIQGGDPLSKDPAKFAQYGTGGLNVLEREPNGEKHTAGAVSAVLVPGKPDSAGTQFFVCASDQPSLDGQFDVFGRVIEGLDVVQQISAVDADAGGHPGTRIVIRAVTIRDAPPPVVDPFVAASPADMAAYHAVIETTKGAIELQFFPDKAPETVRNFLELASHQVYDGIKVHRVVPGFVIQTGALAFRDKPLTAEQQKLVHDLHEEFTDTPNVPGLVSMARGDDPNSASTSFFICVGECHALDGKYTAFAQVVAGMDVVKAIESTPVDGEAPKTPIVVTRVTVKKP
jgi:peptidyl-prolyl cis-trans isomerase B (cyclophilin B)